MKKMGLGLFKIKAPWTLASLKLRVRFMGCLQSFLLYAFLFVIFFLVSPSMAMAIQPGVDWNPILKNVNLKDNYS